MVDDKGRFVRYFHVGVIGVATEAELRNQQNDWLKANTRYNKPRRYAERFVNVEWDVVSWESYCASVSKLESFRYACLILCRVYDGKKGPFNKEYEEINRLRVPRLSRLIKDLLQRNRSNFAVSKAIDEALSLVIDLLKKTKWATPRIAKDGEDLLKVAESMQKVVREKKTIACSEDSIPSTRVQHKNRKNVESHSGSYVLRLEGAQIIADDGTFLGRITSNDCASDSIFNSVGRYGSDFSSTSIWNDISRYGSDLSSESAFNDLASSPPRIVKDGEILGYLTTNDLKSRAVNPTLLLEFLDNSADKMYRKKLLRLKQ